LEHRPPSGTACPSGIARGSPSGSVSGVSGVSDLAGVLGRCGGVPGFRSWNEERADGPDGVACELERVFLVVRDGTVPQAACQTLIALRVCYPTAGLGEVRDLT
jgi:hypothetical protein